MSSVRVIIKDPLGVKHAYGAEAPTLAQAEAHLEAKLAVIVGVPVSASSTDTATDAENDTVVMSADTIWGDLNLVLQKAVVGQKPKTRNVRLNEAESLLNANGKPDLANGKLQLIQNRFSDGDGITGFTLVKAKWEKKFSNR